MVRFARAPWRRLHLQLLLGLLRLRQPHALGSSEPRRPSRARAANRDSEDTLQKRRSEAFRPRAWQLRRHSAWRALPRNSSATLATELCARTSAAQPGTCELCAEACRRLSPGEAYYGDLNGDFKEESLRAAALPRRRLKDDSALAPLEPELFPAAFVGATEAFSHEADRRPSFVAFLG